MVQKTIDSLEVFVDKLCTSLVSEIHFLRVRNPLYTHLPVQVELYGTKKEVLELVSLKIFTHLRNGNSPLASSSVLFRTEKEFPSIQPGTYYIDVEYFFELYERRKVAGENVVF